MSENVEIEEKTSTSSIVESLAAPTITNESSKIIDEHDGKSNLSDTTEKPFGSEQSIAVENSMDVSDESKNEAIEESVELHQNPSVEMESVNNEPASNDEHKQLTNDHTAEPIVDTVISNDSVCINIAGINDSTAISAETQKSCTQIDAITIDVEAKQQKPSAVAPSIGSLGLLNQYASSSDEDEDEDSSESDSSSSNCSSESDDSETETESDEDDDSSVVGNDVEIVDAPSVTSENQLNAMANNILAGAMSRNNYRQASSDT